jgi:predicted SnoaL-like aldol condensation-catalyzing enzyme
MAESYIQHNPTVATGRAAFVTFFSRIAKPVSIARTVKAPLVSIVAESDLVVLSFVRELADPKDAAKKYTTTWFDMYRIEHGKIAEHWDGAQKYGAQRCVWSRAAMRGATDDSDRLLQSNPLNPSTE